MPLIEPEDFPNYPYPRRRVTIRRDPTLILWGVGLLQLLKGISWQF